MYAYLGVTCHLYFWQYDQGLLHATAVIQGVEQTLNKKILLLLLPGFELATFQSRVRRSNQQAIPVPCMYIQCIPQETTTSMFIILSFIILFLLTCLLLSNSQRVQQWIQSCKETRRANSQKTHIQVHNWKTKCVSYVPQIHTSHTKHAVFDLFNVCSNRALLKTTVDKNLKNKNNLLFIILTHL